MERDLEFARTGCLAPATTDRGQPDHASGGVNRWTALVSRPAITKFTQSPSSTGADGRVHSAARLRLRLWPVPAPGYSLRLSGQDPALPELQQQLQAALANRYTIQREVG